MTNLQKKRFDQINANCLHKVGNFLSFLEVSDCLTFAMDDFEFYLNYIHENEIPKDEVNLAEDDVKHYQARNVRVNKGEKKIRGRDLAWVKRISFENSKAFEDSIVMEELKESYTVKRKRVYAYAIVHNYVCKYSQRGQYLPCRKEIRIIFPSESQNVLVQEAGEHEHRSTGKQELW